VIDAGYRESARLRDGTDIVLRTIRPDDKEQLRAGFERLSERSRYLRFHGVKTELSDAELKYLTEVDGVHHVAIVALREIDGGEEGLGVARLVELAAEPGVAEAAITVLDEHQGKGIGKLLFQRLVAAGAERGITRVRCMVLGSNQALLDLLKTIPGASTVSIEGGVATIDIEVPREEPREGGLYELLRLAARRVLELVR
jgi:GNAT superfamily N-acetyltransferase